MAMLHQICEAPNYQRQRDKLKPGFAGMPRIQLLAWTHRLQHGSLLLQSSGFVDAVHGCAGTSLEIRVAYTPNHTEYGENYAFVTNPCKPAKEQCERNERSLCNLIGSMCLLMLASQIKQSLRWLRVQSSDLSTWHKSFAGRNNILQIMATWSSCWISGTNRYSRYTWDKIHMKRMKRHLGDKCKQSKTIEHKFGKQMKEIHKDPATWSW